MILDDKILYEVIYSPVCGRCARLQDGVKKTCGAFPAGIPDAIWRGANKHRKPYPGDHGLTFQERPPRPQKAP